MFSYFGQFLAGVTICIYVIYFICKVGSRWEWTSTDPRNDDLKSVLKECWRLRP